MSTTLRLAFVTILSLLLVACSAKTPAPKPTHTPSPPTGLKGSASLNDPVGDVKLVQGRTLDKSVDLRRIDLMADGSTLHIILQFANPLRPIDQQKLQCRFSAGVDDGVSYLVTFIRSSEAQPPTFWIIQGGFIDPNVFPERHPFTVFGDRISAPIQLKVLDGLPATFAWGVECSREVQTQEDNASVSEDTVGEGALFKGTT